MNCTFNYHPQKEKSRKVFLRAASSNKEISRAVMSRGLAERDIIFFVISILAVYQNKKELIKIYATSTLDSIFFTPQTISLFCASASFGCCVGSGLTLEVLMLCSGGLIVAMPPGKTA
jgi:hypothetical protein